MNNKDFSKSKYIENYIISPLKEWSESNGTQDNTDWHSILQVVRMCENMHFMDELHEQMLPFYEKYLYGEGIGRSNIGYSFGNFICDVARIDNQFVSWAESADLIKVTESWSDSLRRINATISPYMAFVRLLLELGYTTDWQQLSERLKKELHEAEVYSDRTTGEVLCLLHGVAMLMKAPWNAGKKKENLELLFDTWDFLKHVYAVMIRRVIGCGLANFVAVANLVAQLTHYHQHIQIFYCVVCYRQDTLGLTKKQLKSLEEKLVRIRTIMDETKESHDLYELCDTIFPEDFQRMLEEFRPETREEIERERNKLRYEVGILTDQLTSMAEKLKNAVEHSVPIDEIESQLLRLSPGTALDLCAKLTLMLSDNKAWMSSMPAIKEKILLKKEEQDRKVSELLQVIAEKQPVNVNVGAGATAQITERDIINQSSGLLA